MGKRTASSLGKVTYGTVKDVQPEQLAARQPPQPRAELKFLLELHRLGNTAKVIDIRNLLRRALLITYPTFDLVHALRDEGYLTILHSKSNGVHHRKPVKRIDLTAKGLELLKQELDHVCKGCAPLTSG